MRTDSKTQGIGTKDTADWISGAIVTRHAVGGSLKSLFVPKIRPPKRLKNAKTLEGTSKNSRRIDFQRIMALKMLLI
jgi:hypothetical protein